MSAGKRLPRAFFDRDTQLVARELLGKHLVHVVDGVKRVGRIVETEAYLGPHDLAAHSARGLTPRTRVMFGPPGHVVTEAEGHASAVLLRALEPVANVEGRTQGPGLLCKAMGIDKRRHGEDLEGRILYLCEPGEAGKFRIARRPRIGVDYAGHWARRLLRCYIRGNPYVSRL
jgi:DNA-3-methyladenine glycosylase